MVLFDLQNFLMVGSYNMDEHLEFSWRSIYYQASEEEGITSCINFVDRRFTLGVCMDVHTHLLIDHCRVIFLCMLKFHGWSQPKNYFNSEVFLMYGNDILRSSCSTSIVEYHLLYMQCVP